MSMMRLMLLLLLAAARAGPAAAQGDVIDSQTGRTTGGLALPQAPQPAMTDNVPRPDPSILTTQQLVREIQALKEVIFTRLQGMDEAILLRTERTDAIPGDIERRMSKLQELMEEKLDGVELQVDEKFRSIQQQFEERDTRVAQTSVDSKLAIDAALQAAKEAVGKSELGTKDVIQQQGDLLRTVTAALGANLDDLKQRTTAIESKTLGIGEAKGSFTDNTGMLVGIGGLALALVVFLSNRRQEPQIRYVQAPQPQPPQGITTTTNTSAA